MSVVTAFSLAFLLIFSPLVSASADPDAAPCPDCEDGEQPVRYAALTRTTSTCTTHQSVFPYTSGTHTFYISTKTVTEQGHCKTHTKHHGECYPETVILPAHTATIYKNGSNTNVGPVQTVTLTVPTTHIKTITSWKRGRAPETVTETETERPTRIVNRPTETKIEVSTTTVGGKVLGTETVKVTVTPKHVPTVTETITEKGGRGGKKTVTETTTVKGSPGYCPTKTITLKETVTHGGHHSKTKTKGGHTKSVPAGYPTRTKHTKTATEETPTKGTHTKATRTKGTHTKGTHTKGTHTKGTHTKGTHTKETHTKATHTKGTHTKGTHTKGTHTKGTHTKGTHTKGPHTKSVTHLGGYGGGTKTKGTHTKGTRTKAAHTKGTHTKATHTKGTHTKGTHTKPKHTKTMKRPGGYGGRTKTKSPAQNPTRTGKGPKPYEATKTSRQPRRSTTTA